MGRPEEGWLGGDPSNIDIDSGKVWARTNAGSGGGLSGLVRELRVAEAG